MMGPKKKSVIDKINRRIEIEEPNVKYLRGLYDKLELYDDLPEQFTLFGYEVDEIHNLLEKIFE